MLLILTNKSLMKIILIFNWKNIEWVIVGGESEPKTRPMKEEWGLDIKYQCKEAEVPFFPKRDGKPKQWGGKNKKKTGRLLAGRTWDELPVKRAG